MHLNQILQTQPRRRSLRDLLRILPCGSGRGFGLLLPQTIFTDGFTQTGPHREIHFLQVRTARLRLLGQQLQSAGIAVVQRNTAQTGFFHIRHIHQQ